MAQEQGSGVGASDPDDMDVSEHDRRASGLSFSLPSALNFI
ncbi:Protein of unknown function [Pyronema omphalodes CBS 100304]|uniref:Uncharacterized protein n=1 Tax=Pyronema omphalodes (strain CBS 100304) TaxID=1076935 RepID=U4LUA3_PYROM|nr:Protein of unknown function [Pyronema omphalodes CBS 100304]